jgi:hypothetical protein
MVKWLLKESFARMVGLIVSVTLGAFLGFALVDFVIFLARLW